VEARGLTFGRVSHRASQHGDLRLGVDGRLGHLAVDASRGFLKTHPCRRALRLSGVLLYGTPASPAGVVAILSGWTDGLQWLEIPWQIGILLAIGGRRSLRDAVVPHVCASATSITCTFRCGTIGAALLWFPDPLRSSPRVPHVHFRRRAGRSSNWWYAHKRARSSGSRPPRASPRRITFIAKVLGRPIFSYSLSLVGFLGARDVLQPGGHSPFKSAGPVPELVGQRFRWSRA